MPFARGVDGSTHVLALGEETATCRADPDQIERSEAAVVRWRAGLLVFIQEE